MEDDSEDLGYLGTYGVMIVPPPPGEYGGWLVTVARWNEDLENYLPSHEGPIFESEEEAVREVRRALTWLEERGEETNLIDVWEHMQQQLSGDRLQKIDPDENTAGW